MNNVAKKMMLIALFAWSNITFSSETTNNKSQSLWYGIAAAVPLAALCIYKAAANHYAAQRLTTDLPEKQKRNSEVQAAFKPIDDKIQAEQPLEIQRVNGEISQFQSEYGFGDNHAQYKPFKTAWHSYVHGSQNLARFAAAPGIGAAVVSSVAIDLEPVRRASKNFLQYKKDQAEARTKAITSHKRWALGWGAGAVGVAGTAAWFWSKK